MRASRAVESVVGGALALGFTASPSPARADPTCDRLLRYAAGLDAETVQRAAQNAGEDGDITPETTTCLRDRAAPDELFTVAFRFAPDSEPQLRDHARLSVPCPEEGGIPVCDALPAGTTLTATWPPLPGAPVRATLQAWSASRGTLPPSALTLPRGTPVAQAEATLRGVTTESGWSTTLPFTLYAPTGGAADGYTLEVRVGEATMVSLPFRVAKAIDPADHVAVVVTPTAALVGRPESGFTVLAALPDVLPWKVVAAPLDGPASLYVADGNGLLAVDLHSGASVLTPGPRSEQITAVVGGVLWTTEAGNLWLRRPGRDDEELAGPGQVETIDAVAERALAAVVTTRTGERVVFHTSDPLTGPIDRSPLPGLTEMQRWVVSSTTLSPDGRTVVALGTPENDSADWRLVALRVSLDTPATPTRRLVTEVTLFPVIGSQHPVWVDAPTPRILFPISICEECDLGADSTWSWQLDPETLHASLAPPDAYDPADGPLVLERAPDGKALAMRFLHGGPAHVAVEDIGVVPLPKEGAFVAWLGARAEPETSPLPAYAQQLRSGLRSTEERSWWPGKPEKPSASPARPASTPTVNRTSHGGSINAQLHDRAVADLVANPQAGWQPLDGVECRGNKHSEPLMDTTLALFLAECRSPAASTRLCGAEVWCRLTSKTDIVCSAILPTPGAPQHSAACTSFLEATVGTWAHIPSAP